MAVSAGLRGEGEGQDLGLVGGEAGQDEARGLGAAAEEQAVGENDPVGEEALEFERAPRPREGARMDRGEAAGVLGAEGREADDRPRAAEARRTRSLPGDPGPVLGLGVGPAQIERLRQGLGRIGDAPRGGRPRRCRAPRARRRR